MSTENQEKEAKPKTGFSGILKASGFHEIDTSVDVPTPPFLYDYDWRQRKHFERIQYPNSSLFVKELSLNQAVFAFQNNSPYVSREEDMWVVLLDEINLRTQKAFLKHKFDFIYNEETEFVKIFCGESYHILNISAKKVPYFLQHVARDNKNPISNIFSDLIEQFSLNEIHLSHFHGENTPHQNDLTSQWFLRIPF